jgi:hypothetical protein
MRPISRQRTLEPPVSNQIGAFLSVPRVDRRELSSSGEHSSNNYQQILLRSRDQ